jgi:hypothetical protein
LPGLEIKAQGEVYIPISPEGKTIKEAVRQSLGEPDPFRLRYRTRIYEFVAAVVQSQMTKREAIRWIARESEERISVEDRVRFIEVVETELSSLHEGNIARYRLRPSEFEAWYRNWK